ncbi:amino acid permease-domain-containing protein [Gongronella butleri]|nr:amino acid permease-domain-containing protein [Gongronella butleri]
MLKHTSAPSRYPNLPCKWEFAGYGATYYMELDGDKNEDEKERHLLGQFRATSISGNDLFASVFYFLGPVVVQAGQYAPISMLLVALFMYPVKRIMTEVITCVKLNGGTYNAMLHTTAKVIAALAACFSILDYLATCGVSASSSAAYLAAQVTLPSALSPFLLTLIILIAFGAICLFGIRESSTVSLAICMFHLLTMAVLVVACIVQWVRAGNAQLVANWQPPPPNADSNAAKSIFKGFCYGLLGVTGIEAAENIVEDLKPNTFPKVMNNMYVFLVLFNAPITFLATVLVPVADIQGNAASATSILASHATPGQQWLPLWVLVDAVVVLCAGVLTGMIGAIGLVSRLASDRILPQALLAQNKWTGSYHYITLIFLVLNVILCCIVRGDASSLSGVFSVAILGVLTMYALANVLLKYKRGRLPRLVRVNVSTAILALLTLVMALVANIVFDPSIAAYFLIYYVIVAAVVLIMLKRGTLLKVAYWLIDQMDGIPGLTRVVAVCARYLEQKIIAIREQPTVFFVKTDEPHILNKAILYVQRNESSNHIKFIHLYDRVHDIPEQLETNHRLLDEVYPKIQLDLVFIQGKFDPPTIDRISRQLNIEKTFMFISTPGPKFPYTIGDLGGVRIIML